MAIIPKLYSKKISKEMVTKSRIRKIATLCSIIDLRPSSVSHITDMFQQPFISSQEYMNALLQQSMIHLKENPMASESFGEACQDYKTIHALQSHFAESSTATNDLFCLSNDDIRFGNMIVDEDFNIVALIDWEFCYAAPSSFLRSPPPWLIGSDPLEWDDTDEYESRLHLFLEILEGEEDVAGLGDTLSTCMRGSWVDGTFWYNVAARESFSLTNIGKHCRQFLPDIAAPADL